jgi:hypothetical protein
VRWKEIYVTSDMVFSEFICAKFIHWELVIMKWKMLGLTIAAKKIDSCAALLVDNKARPYPGTGNLYIPAVEKS